MPLLINHETVNGVSPTFTIEDQVTVYAVGLGSNEYVEFELVLISDPYNGGCACPPAVVLPLPIHAVAPLACCGAPIRLTQGRPYVILDAPQRVPVRARIVTEDAAPVVEQRVWFEPTSTQHPTDFMRGCPCP